MGGETNTDKNRETDKRREEAERDRQTGERRREEETERQRDRIGQTRPTHAAWSRTTLVTITYTLFSHTKNHGLKWQSGPTLLQSLTTFVRPVSL